MVKVKICGITNLEDALVAGEAGCDALGFVFYRESSRFIKPIAAKAIMRRIPKGIIKVGVFVNAKEKTIKSIAKFCGLDILQFHGHESPEFCGRFKGRKVIKAFRVKGKIDYFKVLKYKTFAYLFDAFSESAAGGTGRTFNWQLLKLSHKCKRPLFLSGGLNKNDVRRAIRIVRPDWVDVSSSVEAEAGRKDHGKVREFIRAAKG